MGLEKRPSIYLLYPWVAAGFGLRLWHALINMRLAMCRDETTYAYQIKHVLNGTLLQDGSFITFPPVFALLAAPAALINGDPEMAGRIVSCVMGAAATIPAYYLARELFGLRTAAVTAALTAVFPPLLGAGVMSEPTYTFFIMLGLYLGNRAYGSGKRRDWAAFGVAMALGYLTRPEGLFVFFVYLGILLCLLAAGKAGARKALTFAAFALAGFFVLAFPYMLKLRQVSGGWEISGKTSNNLDKMKAIEAMRSEGDFEASIERVEAARQKDGKGGLAGDVRQELGAMLMRYPANFKTEAVQFAAAAGYPALAAFILGTLVILLQGRDRIRTLAPLMAASVPMLLIPLVFVLQRVIVPYLPLVLMVSASGAVWAAEAIGRKAPAANGAVPAVLMTVFFGAALMAGNFGRLIPETDIKKIRANDWICDYYVQLREVAVIMKPYFDPPGKVITRNNVFAYYAGCEYQTFPYRDAPGLVKYARENGAGYIFYGPMERDTYPQLTAAFFRDGQPTEDPTGDGSLKVLVSGPEMILYSVTPQEKR